MSKTLVALIDSAIIPAATMICGKILGLFFVNYLFGLDWSLESDSNNLFSIRIIYNSYSDQLLASSYSNLIMFLFVVLGFSYVLISALYFHNSHVSPSIITKLATKNLLNVIKDSFAIYSKASVWIVFLWLSFCAIFLNYLLGRTYNWITVVTFLLALGLTVVLLRDVNQEINIAKRKF